LVRWLKSKTIQPAADLWFSEFNSLLKSKFVSGNSISYWLPQQLGGLGLPYEFNGVVLKQYTDKSVIPIHKARAWECLRIEGGFWSKYKNSRLNRLLKDVKSFVPKHVLSLFEKTEECLIPERELLVDPQGLPLLGNDGKQLRGRIMIDPVLPENVAVAPWEKIPDFTQDRFNFFPLPLLSSYLQGYLGGKDELGVDKTRMWYYLHNPSLLSRWNGEYLRDTPRSCDSFRMAELLDTKVLLSMDFSTCDTTVGDTWKPPIPYFGRNEVPYLGWLKSLGCYKLRCY